MGHHPHDGTVASYRPVPKLSGDGYEPKRDLALPGAGDGRGSRAHESVLGRRVLEAGRVRAGSAARSLLWARDRKAAERFRRRGLPRASDESRRLHLRAGTFTDEKQQQCGGVLSFLCFGETRGRHHHPVHLS